MKLKTVLREIYNEKEIRIASWLYMIVYPYNNKMKISDWKTDNRMGVDFLSSIKNLENDGFVKIQNEYVIATPKAKPYLNKIFGKFDDEETAIEFGLTLKKYDTSKFTISEIPVNMFERDYTSKVRSLNRSIGSFKYKELVDWIKKYQRSPISVKSAFKPFLGDSNLVDLDYKYVLYRGFYVSKYQSEYEKVSSLKVGDSLNENGISWSKSKDVALNFAKGSKHWMDPSKFKQGESIAVLLKYHFNHSDILVDLHYIDSQGDYSIVDFPNEKEVIVWPKNYKCKIEQILK